MGTDYKKSEKPYGDATVLTEVSSHAFPLVVASLFLLLPLFERLGLLGVEMGKELIWYKTYINEALTLARVLGVDDFGFYKIVEPLLYKYNGYLTPNGKPITEKEEAELVGVPLKTYRSKVATSIDKGVLERGENGLLTSPSIVEKLALSKVRREAGAQGAAVTNAQHLPKQKAEQNLTSILYSLTSDISEETITQIKNYVDSSNRPEEYKEFIKASPKAFEDEKTYALWLLLVITLKVSPAELITSQKNYCKFVKGNSLEMSSIQKPTTFLMNGNWKNFIDGIPPVVGSEVREDGTVKPRLNKKGR